MALSGRTGHNVSFMVGLVAFLFAHIAYIFSFSDLKLRKSVACVTLVLGILIDAALWAAIPTGTLLVLIIGYSVAIFSAFAFSLSHLLDNQNADGIMRVLGYISFIVSDFLIAAVRFEVLKLPYATWYIMITYFCAIGLMTFSNIVM